MRNAVKRVTHKERGQPQNRKSLGLLEKHKDYKERSYDFHKKKDYIKALKKKASNRNPDEFYHNMHNSKVSNGVHKAEKKDESIDPGVLKLMKTQDLGYITYRKALDDKRIEKLQQNLHFIGKTSSSSSSSKKRHKIFCEDEDEMNSFDPVEHFQTTDEFMKNDHNRLRRSSIDTLDSRSNLAKLTKKDVVSISKQKEKSYNELEKRLVRSKKLETASNGLQLQRHLNGKGSKRKIVDADDPDKVVYKWKRQRAK